MNFLTQKEEKEELIAYARLRGFSSKVINLLIEDTLFEPKKEVELNDDGDIHCYLIKGFRCECGANVFHKYVGEKDLYICNACNIEYRAVDKEKQMPRYTNWKSDDI